MRRRPPRSTRTDTLFPYTTLFRSHRQCVVVERAEPAGAARWYRDRAAGVRQVRLPRLDQPWPSCASAAVAGTRSEEHTSELQSLMRISYAVFCLKKKK